MADILAGRVKLAGPMDDMPASTDMPPRAVLPPPAPMAPAPVRPAPTVPKNTPQTPPQPKMPSVKSSALSRAIKNAGLGLGTAVDFARGAGVSAEDLLRKNLTPAPDTYVASLQTQIPDYKPATPTRGPHAAAFSLLH